MSREYFVRESNEDMLFGKLTIICDIKGKSIFYGTNTVISEVLKKYKIEKCNVSSVKTFKEKKKVKIEIEYTKFYLEDILKNKDQERQITLLLNKLGISKEEIVSIKYEKMWPNVDEDDTKVWNVLLDEHFDLDDLSSHTYEISMSKILSKALEFDVSVSCY